MRFLPREEKFFILFLNQVDNICKASELLLEGARSGNARLAEVGHEIQVLETKGDEIIHDVFTRLNQTFITPLDPEDIHELSSSLDNVIDAIEDAAHRMVAYRLEPIQPTIVQLCEIVHRCTQSLKRAFVSLEKNQNVLEHCIEVNRLEDETDKMVRRAISELFETEKDPIKIIKLKEVYEFLEATTDYCEDVTDVLQSVVVKNS